MKRCKLVDDSCFPDSPTVEADLERLTFSWSFGGDALPDFLVSVGRAVLRACGFLIEDCLDGVGPGKGSKDGELRGECRLSFMEGDFFSEGLSLKEYEEPFGEVLWAELMSVLLAL